MIDAALVDEIQLAVDAGRCRSAAARRRRLRPSTAATAAARRRAPTATPAAARRHASRSVQHEVLAAQPVEHRQHLARRQPLVAAHDDAIDLQRRARAPRRAAAAIAAVEHERDDGSAAARGRQTSAASRARLRAGLTCARRKRLIGRRGDGLMRRASASARRSPSASISRRRHACRSIPRRA